MSPRRSRSTDTNAWFPAIAAGLVLALVVGIGIFVGGNGTDVDADAPTTGATTAGEPISGDTGGHRQPGHHHDGRPAPFRSTARGAALLGICRRGRPPRAGTPHRTGIPAGSGRWAVRRRNPASGLGVQEADRHPAMGGLRRPQRSDRRDRRGLAADGRPERAVPAQAPWCRHSRRGLSAPAGDGGVPRRRADLHRPHLVRRTRCRRQAGDVLRDSDLRHRRERQPVSRAGDQAGLRRGEVARRRVLVPAFVRRQSGQPARRDEEPVVLQLRHRHPWRPERADPARLPRLHPHLQLTRRCLPGARRARRPCLRVGPRRQGARAVQRARVATVVQPARPQRHDHHVDDDHHHPRRTTAHDTTTSPTKVAPTTVATTTTDHDVHDRHPRRRSLPDRVGPAHAALGKQVSAGRSSGEPHHRHRAHVEDP